MKSRFRVEEKVHGGYRGKKSANVYLRGILFIQHERLRAGQEVRVTHV